MLKLLKSHHPVRHAKSFKFAFSGILHAIVNEANFRVQIFITIIAAYLGFKLGITHIEWTILILALGLLLGAELVNTVVEEFIDHLIEEHNEGARVIKDLAAGFVLVIALTVLFILYLIFSPYLSQL